MLRSLDEFHSNCHHLDKYNYHNSIVLNPNSHLHECPARPGAFVVQRPIGSPVGSIQPSL